jgi:glycerol-3-phosphate dehydrogenase
MQTPPLSFTTREKIITSGFTNEIDLLIIGGGITGAGIALDAALRNLNTVLIEKNDFASGTSSRSTKLIHGGLRYLKQLEIKLVRDVGRERAVLYKNAMHLVRPEKMLLPIFKNGSLGKKSSSLGLLVYDLLAGVKKNEQRKMLNANETIAQEKNIKKDGLIGGGLYYEYRTDDARLVIELIKSASQEGATCINYLEANEFIYDENENIIGVNAIDKITGKSIAVHAKCVINAAGPSVDLIRKADHSLYGKRLLLTKGVHIVVPFEKLPLSQAAYFDVADGRMIFAIPRNGKTYIGTTDTFYNQEIDNPLVNDADISYLLAATNSMFPNVHLRKMDIESSWAGLRPLIFEEGKGPSELSRKDEIIVSDSGLLSIAGGKLTGYRLMAEKIVDMAQSKIAKQNHKRSKTINYKISGCSFNDEKSIEDFVKKIAAEYQLPIAVIANWVNKYGDHTALIADNFQKMNQHEVSKDVNILLSELDYTIDFEMVLTAEDFMIRRSSLLYFDISLVQKYLEEILNHMQKRLNWNAEEKEKQKAIIQLRVKEATAFE